jgi:hypothetical protein
VLPDPEKLHTLGADRFAPEYHLEPWLPTVSFRRNAPGGV